MQCNFSERQGMAISLTEKPENQSIVTEEQEYEVASMPGPRHWLWRIPDNFHLQQMHKTS